MRTNPDALWYLFKHLCVEEKEIDILFFLQHAQKNLYAFSLHASIRVKDKISH